VLVHVLAGRDRLRGDADRLAVLPHLLARGDVDEGELVSVGDGVAHGHVAPGGLEFGAGLEVAPGQRNRVAWVQLQDGLGQLSGHRPFWTHACEGSR
jgi:hypothetical protein